MLTLKERIAALIAATGPMSVAEYMAICLFDPQSGYYTTREPFGQAGDFTTAPEISQMFGELIGVWLYNEWLAAGSLQNAVVAEIGPGRGTMMKDIHRTVSQLNPAFADAAQFGLIETSPRLREIQCKTLGETAAKYTWHESIETLPIGPLFLVGNELFDAVPIRQYVKTEKGWRERVVGLDDRGALVFAAGPGGVEPDLLPTDAAGAADGAIVEIAPARAALMEDIATRIAASGGAGLFIDYGYLEPAVGDTLQALRNHAFDDALANPGLADLTAHVDFARLADIARHAGLSAQFQPQGEFLLGLGLLERAGRLGADANETGRTHISAAVERLAGPAGMGELFKILAVRLAR